MVPSILASAILVQLKAFILTGGATFFLAGRLGGPGGPAPGGGGGPPPPGGGGGGGGPPGAPPGGGGGGGGPLPSAPGGPPGGGGGGGAPPPSAPGAPPGGGGGGAPPSAGAPPAATLAFNSSTSFLAASLSTLDSARFLRKDSIISRSSLLSSVTGGKAAVTSASLALVSASLALVSASLALVSESESFCFKSAMLASRALTFSGSAPPAAGGAAPPPPASSLWRSSLVSSRSFVFCSFAWRATFFASARAASSFALCSSNLAMVLDFSFNSAFKSIPSVCDA
mmetsp:Transcript_38249/g.60561  ORF Transcript_38249/g.60561 Transcript_38249/m.60561 type:complete len:284 (-) Transcript_38249:1315-2166(-)